MPYQERCSILSAEFAQREVKVKETYICILPVTVISPQKHMLWVLIRSASNEYPQYMFLWIRKKNINKVDSLYFEVLETF